MREKKDRIICDVCNKKFSVKHIIDKDTPKMHIKAFECPFCCSEFVIAATNNLTEQKMYRVAKITKQYKEIMEEIGKLKADDENLREKVQLAYDLLEEKKELLRTVKQEQDKLINEYTGGATDAR